MAPFLLVNFLATLHFVFYSKGGLRPAYRYGTKYNVVRKLTKSKNDKTTLLTVLRVTLSLKKFFIQTAAGAICFLKTLFLSLRGVE